MRADCVQFGIDSSVQNRLCHFGGGPTNGISSHSSIENFGLTCPSLCGSGCRPCGFLPSDVVELCDWFPNLDSRVGSHLFDLSCDRCFGTPLVETVAGKISDHLSAVSNSDRLWCTFLHVACDNCAGRFSVDEVRRWHRLVGHDGIGGGSASGNHLASPGRQTCFTRSKGLGDDLREYYEAAQSAISVVDVTGPTKTLCCSRCPTGNGQGSRG